MLTVQDALLTLQKFWTDRGCLVAQPFNTEVGAGTMNPATVLRVLGPEPWRVAYVEPSVRPDDSRYGYNPNRLQMHTQFQVILKPDPGNPQEIYLESLRALGIDTDAHDIRFVEDNWAQPAIGAWGLGWEVWMDGMEITQFTYFQQVGGQNLDPVSVELTYGMERILMAVQGVSHFKDMVYADGITYGEIYGQGEYEMSRYYLDAADVAVNSDLFNHYIFEAERMVEERLPVPAHTYVLKASHAFNVRDARGAISTTERAQAFAKIRRLARDVSALWIERREELGFPLLDAPVPAPVGSAVMPPSSGISDDEARRGFPDVSVLSASPAQQVALEFGFEELPPHVLEQAISQVRDGLESALAATRLEHGDITVDGTPRRIVAVIADVAALEPDATVFRKGPRVTAAFDADGNPTRAAEGFARGQGVAVDELVRADFDGHEHLAVEVTETGRSVFDAIAEVVASVVSGLRADKNMRWSDPELAYSRPLRWLVALWGSHVIPLGVSALRSGRTTYVLRGDAEPLVSIGSAEELLPTLAGRGIMLASADRIEAVRSGALELAATVGGTVDLDAEADLVAEIAGLVEAPHGILGSFDADYLRVPEDILTTVMRTHQRYLPVRAADGSLMPYFITFANGDCDDEAVRAGNENVLRARYEDAAFFYDADLKVALADFRANIDKLTFENRLGSMAARADRIRDLAAAFAGAVTPSVLSEADAATLARAGELVKFDLATDMVVELSSLAGVMAKEYATKAGETADVAEALFEAELPRYTGDALPVSTPGALLALADRFDLLVAMFAIGAKPTGSSDPFALRRAALGAAMTLRAHPELGALSVTSAVAHAAQVLREQGVDVDAGAEASAIDFVTGRYAQLLRDEGTSAEEIAAVEALLVEPARAAAALEQIDDLRDVPGAEALVEQVQRITRIVPEGTAGILDRAHLSEPAEIALADAVEALADHRGSTLQDWAADAAAITTPLTTFFDEILVMAKDDAVRTARLGLLQTVVDRAPSGITWRALDALLG